MKDINGIVLNIGDTVVFVANATQSPCLKTGTVTKIYSNDRECSVNGYSHVQTQRVMKLQQIASKSKNNEVPKTKTSITIPTVGELLQLVDKEELTLSSRICVSRVCNDVFLDLDYEANENQSIRYQSLYTCTTERYGCTYDPQAIFARLSVLATELGERLHVKKIVFAPN